MNKLKITNIRSINLYIRLFTNRTLLPCGCFVSHCGQYAAYSAESAVDNTSTVQPPHIKGADKVFPKKIEDLVDAISKLNLLEVVDLNELLKKRLRIQDIPMMAPGSFTAPASTKKDEEADEEAKVEQKTMFSVKLTKFDETKKVALIKQIKSLVEGLNLVQAKKFVESLPQVVKADLSKQEAEELKTKLEGTGATVQIV